MLEALPLRDWRGPYGAELKARAVTALEQGAVLVFPDLAFVLSENEKPFLDPRVADGRAKNISLNPGSGKLRASSLTGEAAARLAAMIERFGADAAALVQDLLPYRNVERARTSYRPVEVKGRAYSRISDDRLLHIDAFPSRPMRGRRILRFFANVAPASPRRWQVGEPFEPFAKDFLPRVRPHLPGKSWLYDRLGVTHGRRSGYDEIMLSLHDAAKRDDAFQNNSPRQDVAFAPGCCWLAFTDQVLHAALGGQFALEQTFHLEVGEMADPARAPLKILERLSGRILT